MTTKKLNISGSVTSTSAEPINEMTKAEAKEKLKKLIAEETKMVKGIFKNFETPGAIAHVHVRKYPGIPDFRKSMIDGGTYEVPLYVARFLNGIDVSCPVNDGKIGTCSYPVHGFRYDGNAANLPSSQLGQGPDGTSGVPVPLIHVAKRVQRYGFQSLEFGSAFAA